MRVGDEHLAKGAIGHPLHQGLHPFLIDFVKDVVQQKNGLHPCGLFDEGQLCEPQRHHKGLLLTLASKALQGMGAQGEHHIVLVDAHGGAAQPSVLVLGLMHLGCNGFGVVVHMGGQAEPHFLCTS